MRGRKGLKSGYCGNDRFVADREGGVHYDSVVTSFC